MGYQKAQALWAMAATDKARTGHEMNTILVIEDDWAVRELFAIELASEGVDIVAVGEVESIRENKGLNPDLVLLDIYERKLRWDVLVDIKEQNPKLPVIIVNDFDDYSHNPYSLLADGSWIKSYWIDDLKQKIAEVLQGKQKILFQPEKGDKANGKAE
jgi:DNA-binding NtrC family response regulator